MDFSEVSGVTKQLSQVRAFNNNEMEARDSFISAVTKCAGYNRTYFTDLFITACKHLYELVYLLYLTVIANVFVLAAGTIHPHRMNKITI